VQDGGDQRHEVGDAPVSANRCATAIGWLI
jgi:hypothetical protein